MAGDLDEAERMLAGELINPLVVPNSTFSAELTNAAKAKAADEVAPVNVTIRQGEVIVRNGSQLTATDIEKIDVYRTRRPNALKRTSTRPDRPPSIRTIPRIR